MEKDDAEWYIGGWADIDGHHYNTEGDNADPFPQDDELADVDYIQVHITGPGVDSWVTIHGPWEDWEDFYDEVDYFIDNDGGS